MPINRGGPIFAAFCQGKQVQPTTVECAATVVESLLAVPANARPGLLFGKVQSGKTRTFITALALAFDNGFDLAVVFTKGVKVLTQQTVARISQEFEVAASRDLVHVFEIMATPENLPRGLISQKLVIVCKKEDDNINRLHRLFDQIYPSLKGRRCLVIDDEADFASVGYRRDGGVVVSAVIPLQLDRLRRLMQQLTVLQVTATPYSLYLQPEVVPQATGLTLPIRPSFTHLVPEGPGYVGGEVYFEKSLIEGAPEELFHITVSRPEMEVLRREDRARFHVEDCLSDPQIECFRRAIVTFLLGGVVRRWQARQENAADLPRFAFIVHSETAKQSHSWQVTLAERIRDDLRRIGPNSGQLRELVRTAHDDLGESIRRSGLRAPGLDEAITGVYSALDDFMVHKVNSEPQMRPLLNAKGELSLIAHHNVFVGGNILDRGVTVSNVIGFFYGRRPNVTQQDTVLQHCRMYGYRAPQDLAVTRFYTTSGIYASMRMIHQFDKALRADIEAGRQPGGVYFLRADAQGRVRPCGPQRVLASRLEAILPDAQKLLLPLGFDVRVDVTGTRATEWIDEKLSGHFGDAGESGPRFGEIPAQDAEIILEHIRRSLDLSGTDGWDAKGHSSLLKFLAAHHDDGANVAVCVIRGGNQARVRGDGRFQNYFAYQRDVNLAKQNLAGRPGLLLFRQNPGAGFKPHPFWWPMILTPSGIQPHVFALS
jgi:Z1 domain